jgi:hypothetical protein
VAVLLAVLSIGVTLWSWPLRPITSIDQDQPRLNQAAPLPRAPVTIGQSFVAGHDGLSGVEVLAVVYPDPATEAAITLRLTDAAGAIVITQTFTNVQHNSPMRMTFPPLAPSAGRAYTLTWEGSSDARVTAWAYSLDGYARGNLLVGGAPASGDLRFSTFYTYGWMDILRDAALSLGRVAGWAIPLWLILFAPGLLLLGQASARPATPWTRWGMALGLSLSILPLTWQWSTVIGLRWSALTLTGAYGIVGLVVLGQTAWHWRACAEWRPRLTWLDIGMGIVILGGLLARLLAARDQAFPMWVDSPHHLIIARLFAELGQVPASYLPVLPIEYYTYHFGFHVLAVAFHWITSESLVETMLFLGQVLNALMPLAVYPFVVALTGRPRAGLIGSGFVACVSLFPAYYLSWGRYTQLVGLLILAPLLAVTWKLAALEPKEVGSLPHTPATNRFVVFTTVILASGLLFAHYRVMAFYATFVLAVLAAGRTGGWKWVALAGLAAAASSLPWLLRLSEHWFVPVFNSPARLISPGGYNDFPFAYFQSALERGWIAAALLALAWGLWRRERMIWGLGGWVAVTFALLNISSGSWLVNNNSWAISLFVPGALLIGWGADRLLTWVNAGLTPDVYWLRRGGALGSMLILAGVGSYVLLHGLYAQITVANPATVLATADDVPALNWVERHTSPDSIFLVNSWYWQSDLWSGPDSGAWLWSLLGRKTTMPPADYSLQPDWASRVNAFNERLSKITDASAPEMLALLREAGVTHVFIGARGGTLKPEMFVNSPHYRLLYTNGAAWVFEVTSK